MVVEKILEIRNLTKKFGQFTAVENLNLEIYQGQVFGLLGPNGSGKTTTLAMLLDVIAPTSGSYSWFDGIETKEARKRIGSILEMPSFFPYLNAVQNLQIVAHIKGKGKDRLDDVLRQVKLYDRRHDKFKTYSLGMKQRLSIAAALVADPPLLILDEPTNGLDPEGISEVRELIAHIASQGKTIILASHLLDEVQKVCTHFCVLKNGIKKHEGPVQDIIHETNQVTIATDSGADVTSILKAVNGIIEVKPNGNSYQVFLEETIDAARLNEICFSKGITLKKLLTKSNTLEEEFLKILKEND